MCVFMYTIYNKHININRYVIFIFLALFYDHAMLLILNYLQHTVDNICIIYQLIPCGNLNRYTMIQYC